MSEQREITQRFRLRYDSDSYRRVVGGKEVIIHCHHYNSRLQRTIEGATEVDGRAIVSSSAETVFAEHLRGLIRPEDDEATRWAVARALYAHLGFGSLNLEGAADGVVEAPASHFVEGWLAGFAETNRTVCTFTEGYLQGAYAAVTGKRVRVREEACMGAGAERCRFVIESGDAGALQDAVKKPLSFTSKRRDGFEHSKNVDEERIISALVDMPIHGNDMGLIPAFGVYLANMPADFYNQMCIRFAEAMGQKGLFNTARRLLIADAETCAMNTFRGIMSSPEWDGLVAPMIKEERDTLFGIVAISNALGWGNWHVRTHAPAERLVMESLNGYEALGYREYRGTSKEPQCFMLTGVAAGTMELLYSRGSVEERFGTFISVEQDCICCDKPSCTFDVNKA